jgi:hypothetical protein
LELGYFLSVPLVKVYGREVITAAGQHAEDIVVLDLDTLRPTRKFTGSKKSMLSIKLVGPYLIGSNPEELIVWDYGTGQIVFREQLRLVYDIAWSARHQLAFLCSRYYLLVLDLKTGRFLGEFDKLADLSDVAVSDDGELLALSRLAAGDERERLAAETPRAIRRRLQQLARVTNMPEDRMPLTEVRRLRRIIVWRIAAIRQYFADLAGPD